MCIKYGGAYTVQGELRMKITFIEPTPSPNTMKLHLDESLEPNSQNLYTRK